MSNELDLPAIRDRAAAFEAAQNAAKKCPLTYVDEVRNGSRFIGMAWTTTLADDVRGLCERVEELERANDVIGFWLSAALDDKTACAEFKAAVAKWFEVQNPQPRGRDE